MENVPAIEEDGEFVADSPSRHGSPQQNSPRNTSTFSNQSCVSYSSSPLQNIHSLPLSPIPGSPSRQSKVLESDEKRGEIDESRRETGKPRRPKTRIALHKRIALMVTRILGCIFCLISFSIMAANEKKGWALDSFHRYKEFRYGLSLAVIGFVCSGCQALAMAIGKRYRSNLYRRGLDFALDQLLAYLLLSASCSASSRVEDWEANWGTDEFPTIAKVSVIFSFLAFVVFAMASLISGFNLLENPYF